MMVDAALPRSPAETDLLALLRDVEPTQARARDELARRGLPNRRDEAWKWSDLRTAVSEPLGASALYDREIAESAEFAALSPYELIIANGQLYWWPGDDLTGLELRQGSWNLSEPANAEAMPVGALAAAQAGNKLILLTVVEQLATPIILRFVDTPRCSAHGVRVEVLVEPGASATLIERYEGACAPAFANVLVVCHVEDGASLRRVVVQEDRGAGVLVSTAQAFVGAGASFKQCAIAEGGKLVRLETHVTAEGERAEIELNGVYLCADERHADLTSIIRHEVAGGTTRQLVKGAVRAGGRGVFQGKLVVERGAQKTDARQHHQALLLEEGAEAFAKPELIINADDVQCAHGNTIGAVDENALFYMRQRGLPEPEARALLVEAFLIEALPEDIEPLVRDYLTAKIATWLRGAP